MGVISNRIGAIFLPVSDLEAARAWYCSLLEIDELPEIVAGHLCCLPMQDQGMNLILDSKIYKTHGAVSAPVFHFNTDDIHAAYERLRNIGVEFLTGIENGHWFSFKDPDGNPIMICQIS